MQPVVLVTGASRGIGLEFCRFYSAEGCRVLAVCRKLSSQLLALSGDRGGVGTVNVIGDIDVASDRDVQSLAQRVEALLGESCIDLLVNNAGQLMRSRFGDIDFSESVRLFEVNALGPLRVTQALSSTLSSGAKVALITSRMGSIADNSSGGSYNYRMSKAALNAAGVSLAHDLRPRGVAVGLFHPGYVQTEMVEFRGDITVELCVERLAARFDELKLSSSGSFWHSNGEILPW